MSEMTLNDWIEKNDLKRLEEEIAITINEVDDIDSCVRIIMIFVRQALADRLESKLEVKHEQNS